MTGYGNHTIENDNWIIKTEIKSLNSKYFELNLKLPKRLKSKEIEIRQWLQNQVQRGTCYCFIYLESKNEQLSELKLNKKAILNYYQSLKEISSEIGDTNLNILDSVMKLPDILISDDEELSINDYKLVLNSLENSFSQFELHRKNEGEFLKQYLLNCISEIDHSLKDVPNHETERRENLRNKLSQNLQDISKEIQINENRLEQELIYYYEKIDIAEEKSRLEKHLNYFKQCLEDEPSGKKLGFISQEIGREINTMGSKAMNFPIQQLVVKMKEELEKIKEQLLNIV